MYGHKKTSDIEFAPPFPSQLLYPASFPPLCCSGSGRDGGAIAEISANAAAMFVYVCASLTTGNLLCAFIEWSMAYLAPRILT